MDVLGGVTRLEVIKPHVMSYGGLKTAEQLKRAKEIEDAVLLF